MSAVAPYRQLSPTFVQPVNGSRHVSDSAKCSKLVANDSLLSLELTTIGAGVNIASRRRVRVTPSPPPPAE